MTPAHSYATSYGPETSKQPLSLKNLPLLSGGKFDDVYDLDETFLVRRNGETLSLSLSCVCVYSSIGGAVANAIIVVVVVVIWNHVGLEFLP